MWSSIHLIILPFFDDEFVVSTRFHYSNLIQDINCISFPHSTEIMRNGDRGPALAGLFNGRLNQHLGH